VGAGWVTGLAEPFSKEMWSHPAIGRRAGIRLDLLTMSSTDAQPEDVQETPESGAEGWQKQLSGLGSFIRMQRRLADMSLREMASLTSVSNAYLSQVERGLHQPSLRVLRSIAQALSIAPEDLLRRANFMAPRDSGGSGSNSRAAAAAPPDTEAAILADPRLTSAQRDALLNVYRSFRDPA
jgi:transcriptional regulator with XRE-family HTH domain